MNYEIIRQYLIILKNSRKNDFFIFVALWSFVFRHFWHTFLSKKSKEIAVSSLSGDRIFIRTHTSDLLVFMQHFVYQELNHASIKNLPKPALILDAGANIGLATLVLAHFFPEARIIAIEMESENFTQLQRNCKILIENQRVKTFQGAFFPYQTGFFIQKNTSAWNYYLTVSEESQTENMPVFTYQDICEVFEKEPDFIKMDIEGSELAFLKDENWCAKVLKNSSLAVELHSFEGYSEYFYQLRKNNISQATQVGEYWLTIRQ